MKRTTILGVLFAVVMGTSVLLSGCTSNNGGNSGTMNDYDININEKESENFIKFASTQSGFDDFINDYLHRHLRYDDERIGSLALGDSVMFNKEWESLALMWFDSTTSSGEITDDRFAKIKSWISGVTIDKFGYVWAITGSGLEGTTTSAGTYFQQGWPFPAYNTNNSGGKGYEFNRTEQGWTTNADSAKIADGLWQTSYNGGGELVFTSPENINLNTLKSPFLELDIRIADQANFGKNSDIGDIAIRWRTAEDDENGEQGYPHEVMQSDFATIPEETIGASFMKHLYFPMYLHEDWGWDTDNAITSVQIAVIPKQGMSMNIKADINYIRFNFDTRQSNNAVLLLTAAKNYQEFTGDLETLKQNLPRYRQAMQFMLGALGGKENKLIDVSYFAGHDGVVLDERGRATIGHGIGNGYWDILAFPGVDFYSNVYYYKALKAMAYLESIAEANHIDVGTVQVASGANDGTTETYSETSATLEALAESTRTEIQQYFWNEKTGRFHMGYNLDDPNHQNPVDYGYVIFNEEAIVAGIPTEEQEKSIMSWINGDRTVAGDTSQGADIYRFRFAPRTSTLRNDSQYFWGWSALNVPFGQQVQDGGAVLYTSYYDLLARIKVLGVENAWARFKEIQKWYEDIKSAGGEGTRFYREYYDNLGDEEQCLQGGGTAGGLGLDEEFLENAILYATVPYGFFGLGSDGIGSLKVSPMLPSEQKFWEIENLMFNGAKYDLRITNSSVELWEVRGAKSGMTVTAQLKKPSGSFTVIVNGKETNDYTEKDGYLLVTFPFADGYVQIR